MKIAILLSALLLEAVSGAALFGDGALWLRGLTFAAAHLLASAAMALAVHAMLPASLQQSRLQGISFLFVVAAVIPVFGPMAMGIGVLSAFRWPRKTAAEKQWKEVELPPLPYQPPQITGRPSYSEGCFFAMLRHSSNAEDHLRAVRGSRLLSDQESIPILSEALKSRIDDVRLLAYGLLDAKQRKLLGRIQRETKELSGATPAQQPAICKQLAYDYWELVHLGFVQHEMLIHTLSQAAQYAQQALESHPQDGCLTLLLGRIQLREGRTEEAAATLQRALDLGLPASSVNPHLAEVAFRNRDFAAVREYFRSVDPGDSSETVRAMAAYWR